MASGTAAILASRKNVQLILAFYFSSTGLITLTRGLVMSKVDVFFDLFIGLNGSY